jgi:hypothetical protein
MRRFSENVTELKLQVLLPCIPQTGQSPALSPLSFLHQCMGQYYFPTRAFSEFQHHTMMLMTVFVLLIFL